jgi:hypothetical protein
VLELWSAARASSGSSLMASAGSSSSRYRLELIGRQKREALLQVGQSNVVRSVELVVRPWAWMDGIGGRALVVGSFGAGGLMAQPS